MLEMYKRDLPCKKVFQINCGDIYQEKTSLSAKINLCEILIDETITFIR